MFSYLYQGESHTDTSEVYMTALGIDADTQESILSKKQYELDAMCCEVRSERDKRLSDTDHYMLSDVTSPDGVVNYRQALRDIPDQEGFPYSVIWPELESTNP